MDVTKELVEDVAAELGVNEPSLVEKDFYVVQALSVLADYNSPYFELIFAGGTCLSKIFSSLQRMSEDVDLKVLLSEQGKLLSRSKLRKELASLKYNIGRLLESGGFRVSHASARNENHFIAFELIYSALFDVIDALRPNIKIELTLCDYECEHDFRAVASLITQVMNSPPEIEAFPCIGVVHTCAEKLVSLLRRSAASLRGIDEWTDDALVRHIYDLHIITRETDVGEDFIQLVHEVVAGDAKQYANKHKEFLNNPFEELRAALNALHRNSEFREQYERFLGPLVYSEYKPDFDQCLQTVDRLSALVWGVDILPG